MKRWATGIALLGVAWMSAQAGAAQVRTVDFRPAFAGATVESNDALLNSQVADVERLVHIDGGHGTFAVEDGWVFAVATEELSLTKTRATAAFARVDDLSHVFKTDLTATIVGSKVRFAYTNFVDGTVHSTGEDSQDGPQRWCTNPTTVPVDDDWCLSRTAAALAGGVACGIVTLLTGPGGAVCGGAAAVVVGNTPCPPKYVTIPGQCINIPSTPVDQQVQQVHEDYCNASELRAGGDVERGRVSGLPPVRAFPKPTCD